jgi:hypothetical protein
MPVIARKGSVIFFSKTNYTFFVGLSIGEMSMRRDAREKNRREGGREGRGRGMEGGERRRGEREGEAEGGGGRKKELPASLPPLFRV